MNQRGSLLALGSLALLALVACGGGAQSPDGGDAATGAAGKPGDAAGTAGTGSAGTKGTAGTGAAGKPGTAGTTGAAGKPGTAGTTGGAGTTGSAGTTGGAGADGGQDRECLDTECDGTCKGESCDGAWTCDMTAMICTLDVAEYCGCDGETFMGSSTCPKRAFAHRGACATVSCDPRKILCKIAQPTCPVGQVPSVKGTCYGPCVDIDACACTAAAQCPSSDKYTCHVGARHCGPYVM